MKAFFLIILTFFLAILQANWAYFFNLHGTLLNLILIFSIYYLIKAKFLQALAVSFLGGLLLDFFFPVKFGTYLFSLLFATFIINLIYRFLPWQRLIFRISFLFLSFSIYYLTFTLTNFLFTSNPSFSFSLFYKEIFYNLAASLFIFYFLKGFNKKSNAQWPLIL